MRKTTVYDVAERAGVSTATVSFTFRRPDKVKPATRERVLKAARELDYVPSANARGLARGKTGALGLYSFDMLIERPQGSDLEDFGHGGLEAGQWLDHRYRRPGGRFGAVPEPRHG